MLDENSIFRITQDYLWLLWQKQVKHQQSKGSLSTVLWGTQSIRCVYFFHCHVICFLTLVYNNIWLFLTDLPNNVCIANTATTATDMLQVVDFSRLLQVAASLLTSLSCSKSVKIRLVATWYLQTFASSLWIRSQLSICSKPVDNLLETCYIEPEQVMRTHPDIGLMTEACNRLAANYAFLAVYSHIIIINVCDCMWMLC